MEQGPQGARAPQPDQATAGRGPRAVEPVAPATTGAEISLLELAEERLAAVAATAGRAAADLSERADAHDRELGLAPPEMADAGCTGEEIEERLREVGVSDPGRIVAEVFEPPED